MKHLFSTTLILITILSSSLNAQQISSANYNKEFIHEDFNQEGEYFNIVTTTDNYFILDKGDYLLSRNSNESEYAIIAHKSSVSNCILKTAVRLGPSKNKKASIGIMLKAQQDGKGAIIFEINKKGEYRIKQLLGNTYKTLSGSTKHEGWVKNKIINGVDEHNFIEIRTEKNIYDVYVNSDYITTFFIPDYTSGSCGLIISPETKARIAYYHINTQGESTTPTTSYTNGNTSNINTTIEELNRKINTLEVNNAKLNSLNTEAKENQEKKIESLREKNKDQAAITIDQEKEIASLNRSITDFKDNSLKIEGLEKIITKNTTLVNNLNIEKSVLLTESNKLNKTIDSLNKKNSELADVSLVQEKEIKTLKNSNENTFQKIKKLTNKNAESLLKITSLKTKNANLADVSLEQEKKIVVLKSSITEFKKKSISAITVNGQQTKMIERIKQQVTIEKSVSNSLTNDLKKINQTSNSKILKLTNEVSTLKAQLNSIEQKLKLTNRNGDLVKECAKNIVTLNAKLKTANQEINNLENIKNKHDSIVSDLNSQLTLLNTEFQALNIKTSNLEIINIELKELFILKDFEVNGIKPSELIKQTNTYPTPKEIKFISTIYSIQFGVFMQEQSYSSLKELDDVWYETTEQGTYVYFTGEFKNPQDATAHKNKIAALGYPNAFVVTLTK